ncbi:MAG: hypothetical protein SF053_18090 [Bacteroidia bacterium]|nr:hypothetical protein [Bacteroidia bacterium]
MPARRLRPILLGLLLAAGLPATAQLYLSRYVPGTPGQTGDPIHRIEVFNESQDPVDVSGFCLVTRAYACRLPAGTVIGARTALRLGWVPAAGQRTLIFGSMTDFITLQPDREEGDVVALFDRSLVLRDAVYMSRNINVTFLPMETSLRDGTQLYVPDESDPRMTYMPVSPDPALALVQISGQWRITARATNLIPATRYRNLQARYIDGMVYLSWKTLFENDCYTQVIERSTDGKDYEPMDRIQAGGSSVAPRDYTWYDPDTEKDRVYYYRVMNQDKFGYVVYSPPAKVRTEDAPGGFTFDIIQGENKGTLNVRFSAEMTQQVRVKLLDEQLRELSVLFAGQVDGGRQNLVTYSRPLPVGKYFVIVTTETRRYYEPVIVE